MEAIRWSGDALWLLDQTRLPAEERWLRYTDPASVAQAIQTMVVRGAPAIGIAAAYAMVLAAREAAGQPDFQPIWPGPGRFWLPAAPPLSISSGRWTGWSGFGRPAGPICPAWSRRPGISTGRTWK